MPAAPTSRARAAFVFIATLLCAGPLLPVAQAQLPTLGDAGDLSVSAERKLGDRIAREIYRDPDYIDDPALVDYVGAIWQPLIKSARARGDLSNELQERLAWEIVLARDASVNAFALPGGYLGVHLGLIAIVSTPDELASVLAHELSHVTQRHISRLLSKQSEQTPWLIGAMLLGILAASKSPDAANALILGGQAVSAQNQLNFSRDMEREADRVGYGVLSDAGYDPHGFVTMFTKLQQGSRLNDYGQFPYLRSHPLTTERIADMQARQQLSERVVQRNVGLAEHSMMSARAKVLSHPGVDALRALVAEAKGLPHSDQARTGAAIAHSVSASALPASARQAGVFYGAALASIKLRDFELAGRFIQRLGELTQNDAQATRWVRLLSAELALDSGDAPRAARLAQQDAASVLARPALGAAPGAGVASTTWGRPEMLLANQALLRTGQTAQITPTLQAWVSAYPRDADVWQALSLAYAAQGQRLRALRAEAEGRAAQLDYAGAMDRLRAAQEYASSAASKGAVDHIEASIIDTRARKIALLLKEQALER